jgi:excisionase family DNA binding protein
MPYKIFNLEEAATYLHLNRAELERWVKDGEIPFQKRGERVVFLRRDIDAWASQRVLGLHDRPLAEYHRQTSQGTQKLFAQEAIMPEVIRPEHIDPALAAKTKASVLREMVALAEKTGWVSDAPALRESLEAREELCSTALPEGLALLHARHHEPFLFETSFILLGRTPQEIHFGAPDGRPTRLFFLICCQDDRIHLHTLARLCLMAQKTEMVQQLLEVADAASLYAIIVAAETKVLSTRKVRGA